MTVSSIIKSGSIHADEFVRILVAGEDGRSIDLGDPKPESAPMRSAEMALIEELRSENQRLNEIISQNLIELEKIRREEFERGRKLGKSEAMSDELERTALLAAAIKNAAVDYQEKLDSLEGLAILLAQTGLDRIFSDHQEMDVLIASAIRHRLELLKQHNIIAVFVSPVDFADDAAVNRLKSAVGDTKLDFQTDRKLGSGDCRLSLKLGEVEIGVKPQLKQLDILLRQLAEKVDG